MNLLHYGLQRSGSNYLETLLKKKYRIRFLNSNADRSSPIQKHFRLYDDKNIIPEPQYRNDCKISDFESFEQLLDIAPDYYLVISKDPYSWLLSYKSWAKKCNWPKVSHHYIDEYNLFYGKWLEFSRQSERVLFVRYIDLLKNPDEELSRLESKMDLKKNLLSSIMTSAIRKVAQSGSFSNDRLNYYLNEEYLDEYSKEELDLLNSHLDCQLISQLGYEEK